jgi:RNA polymerase sigma factor (sigma-70 family)
MRSINLLDENLRLWNAFRGGNADAFGELIRVHYQDLFNYGTRFTKDGELVKDCIQDLFLALWRNRLTISETSFVKYYLLKSLRRNLNKAFIKHRHAGVWNELYFESLFGGARLPEEIPSAENKLILEEQLSDLAKKMRNILTNLSKRQQEVIYLRFYMDADIEEIAEIMSLTRQSVYNLLHDALKRLKKLSVKKTFSLSHFFGSFAFFLP